MKSNIGPQLPALALGFILVSALSACVGPPDTPPPPAPQARATPAAPAPAPSPAPSPAPAAGDWSLAPADFGIWVYRRDARGSIALFGPANAGAKLTLRCDMGARKLYLSRATTSASARTMTVRASAGMTGLSARPTGAGENYIAAELTPDAAILDQVSFSRGRFAVESAPDARLIVPSHPEFARVVEDCRS